MSNRNKRLMEKVFEAFKYSEDCLKLVYHRPPFLGGKQKKTK